MTSCPQEGSWNLIFFVKETPKSSLVNLMMRIVPSDSPSVSQIDSLMLKRLFSLSELVVLSSEPPKG